MRNRERVNAILDFKPVDRMPVIEPFVWWDLTLKRWYEEGLPRDVDPHDYFGLDKWVQIWIGPGPDDNPDGEKGGGWNVKSFDDYTRVTKHLHKHEPYDPVKLAIIESSHKQGDIYFWITVEGFFWWPRVLFGIEPHLYAFYDNPELMHRINADQLEFNKEVLKRICAISIPDFITVAEDMSYRSGSMISKKLFDEFMKPYYLELVAFARECGIPKVLVDTDGNFYQLIPWFHEECGVDGFVPVERNAGMDLVQLRNLYPKLNLIGGFDKTKISGPEDVLRAEFNHALPALKTGGIILGTDHQTPPEVSLEGYKQYIHLLNEYAHF